MIFHIEDSDECEHRVWVMCRVSWHAPFDSAPRGSKAHHSAAVKYIRAHGIKACGQCHQSKANGALRFSDGLMYADKMSNWAVTMEEALGYYVDPYSCDECDK